MVKARTGGSSEPRVDDEAARRQRVDLQAARLAAGGDPALVERLLPLVHGRPTTDAAPTGQQTAPAARDSRAPGTQVARLFGELLSGDVHRLRFVHVHTTGLTATTVEADPTGFLRVSPADMTVPWSESLGDGRPDRLTLRYFLAGGSGGRPGQTAVDVRNALIRGLPDLGDTPRSALVLVPPDGRWRLLAEIAERIAGRHRVSAWSLQVDPDVEPHDVLMQFLRHVPARHRLDLVLLDIDPDGTVWLRPEEVFPAGTTVDDHRPRTVAVPLTPGPRGSDVSFAVVVRQGDQPEQWRPAAVVRGRLPERAGSTLRVTYDGPQRIGFPDLDDSNLHRSPTAWLRLLRRVPSRVAELQIDVAVAVELTDPGATERLAFATDTIAALLRAVPPWAVLRVAPIGYHQHVDRESRKDERTRLVWPIDFTASENARRAIGAFRPLPNRNDHAAAVEDMLDALGDRSWRHDADRALVVIGSRPPYPHERHDDVTPSCGRLLPWREPAERLRNDHGVRLVSVWQEPPWHALGPAEVPLMDRLALARKVLGADGLFDLATASPAEVAARVPDDSSWIDTGLPFAVRRGGERRPGAITPRDGGA